MNKNFNLFVLIIVVILFTIGVNSQGSTSQCTYNGINYASASASNGSYSALNAVSGATPAGKYRYYWNICGVATRCGAQAAACQTTVGGTGSPQSVGNINIGSFSAGNGDGPILTYKTNSNPCSGGIFRSIDITLKCGQGSIITSEIIEESKCTYGVIMTAPAFCRSTPTPTPSPQVLCQSTGNSLIVNSSQAIECIGYGPTSCTTLSGSTCSTDQVGPIKCTTPSGSIQCFGSQLQCQTSFASCSINKNSNGLIVNGLETNSNHYDSQKQIISEIGTENSSSSITILCSSLLFFIISLILLV